MHGSGTHQSNLAALTNTNAERNQHRAPFVSNGKQRVLQDDTNRKPRTLLPVIPTRARASKRSAAILECFAPLAENTFDVSHRILHLAHHACGSLSFGVSPDAFRFGNESQESVPFLVEHEPAMSTTNKRALRNGALHSRKRGGILRRRRFFAYQRL